MKRFKWTPPWDLSQAGFLFGQGFRGTYLGFACDEFHNRTFYFMVPAVGFFTLWYGRHLNWTVEHLYGRSGDEMLGYIDPDCDLCAEMLGHLQMHKFTGEQ